jgi:hypothetical protein
VRGVKFARGLRWNVTGVALALALVALGPMARSQTQPDAPRIAFDVLKPRFLSTESAAGSLVVHNVSAERIRYDPFSTSIVLRGDDGTRVERPLITGIRTIGSTAPIEPGATDTFPVMLPKCTVIEDPCDVHVTLNATFDSEKRSFQIRSPERSYTFVADPREAFEEGGSRIAPIVIARAEIEATLPQNVLEVTLHYRAVSDADEIAGIFAARHLSVGSGTSATPDGFDDVRSFNDSDSDSSIDAALTEIEAKLDSRVTIGPRSYVISGSDLSSAQDKATDAVRRAAEGVAAFLDAGSIEDFNLHVLSQAKIATPRGVRLFVLSGPYMLFGLAAATDAVASPTRGGVVDVHVASVAAIAFRDAGTFPACCSTEFRGAEYVGQAGNGALMIPLRLTATDRTEIYAVAESSRQQAARRGLDASSVAFARAAELSQDIASDLGVVAGQMTLVAMYPDVDDGEEKTVVPVGVALAPAGDVDGAWKSIVPSPSPRPKRDELGRPVPIAVSSPTATPVRVLATGPAEGPLPLYAVPIVVRQAETQRSWYADVPVRDIAGGADCATDVRRARRASLSKALNDAVADAHGSGTVLRHLVLVVSYPATIDGDVPCLAPSRLNPVVAHSPVELVFRIR